MLAPSTLLAAAALLTAAPQNALWVVDTSGAGDFLEIVDAVAAASDGDTILVHAGFDDAGYSYSYLPIEIVDKELTIVAELGERYPEAAQVRGIAVRDLAAGKRVVVDGVKVDYTQSGPPSGVQVQDCPGTVHLACERIIGHPDDGPAVRILGSRDVALVGVRTITWAEDPSGPVGFPGIEIVDSQVALQRCEVLGGTGASGSQNEGGPGLYALDSLVFCVRTEIQGGYGGDGDFCVDYELGTGGDGAVLEGSSRLVLVNTSIEGGTGGTNYDFGCSLYGAEGEDLVIGPDAVFEPREDVPRDLYVTRLAREHGKVRVVATGEAGDRLSLVRSKQTSFVYSEEYHGVVHVEPGPGYHVVELGTLGADGLLDVELDVGHLGPAWPGDSFALQVFATRTSGAAAASTPQSLAVIDGGMAQRCEGLRLYVDVDAPPGGDGTRWDRASNDLPATVDQAVDLTVKVCPGFPVQVWVAEGLYTGSVHIRRGVELYGGFAGDETELDERDPVAHPTILSGDVNGDDLPDFGNVSDNLTMVVVIKSGGHPPETPFLHPAVLDGFQVEGAYYDGLPGHGGAIRIEEDFARIRNCVVRRNWTSQGGAGVSMSASLGTRIEITDCRFEGNVAARGGALNVYGSYPELWHVVQVSRCVFQDNVAAEVGGGVRMFDGVFLSDCLFNGNRAPFGGGLYAHTSDEPTPIRGCTFHANVADVAGGGMYLWRPDPSGSLQLMPTVSDTILWGNLTAGLGGELGQIGWEGARPRMLFDCVEGWTGMFTGRGSHGLDPLFIDPLGADGIPGTADDDLHLGAGSPCVDAGSNALGGQDWGDVDGDGLRGEPAVIDIEGRPRRLDDPAVPDGGEGSAPVIDMGAHEREG